MSAAASASSTAPTSTAASPRRTLLRVRRRKDAPAAPLLQLRLRGLKRSAEAEEAAASEDSRSVKKICLSLLTTSSVAAKEEADQEDARWAEQLEKSRLKQQPRLKDYKARPEKEKGQKEQQQQKEQRAERRYKLISGRRQMVEADASNRLSRFNLLDLVQEEQKAEIACNGAEMERERDEKKDEDDDEQTTADDDDYVYDLYYDPSDNLDKADEWSGSGDDRLVGVEFALESDLVHEQYREQGILDDDRSDGEDSNAEDHWANEYPDEEEYDEFAFDGGDSSNDEIGDFGLGDMSLGGGRRRRQRQDSDSSSDGDESSLDENELSAGGDRLVYTRTFEQDRQLHGSSYARFKQRFMREEKKENNDDGDSDDDDIDNVDEF